MTSRARHSLLQLLVEEADVDQFQRFLRDVRDRGVPRYDVDFVEEETIRALQVRAILEERRRREQEFAALYETAGDLARLHDVEQVLRTIVRRARQLLNSDVAYLTLHDDHAEEIYMRVSDGTVSPDFMEIRLPLGSGLGGLVAQNSRPYFTANYLGDSRFDHLAGVDGVVTREGIVAILGVPLVLGNEVIGVLFAADRHERQYTPHDVTLLSSFAAHAAIALENARLFGRATSAVDELERANTTIRAHSQAVERAADAHARLTRLVVEGGNLAELAAAVSEVLDASLMIVDTVGRVLARADRVVDALDETIREQREIPPTPRAAPLLDAIASAGRRGHAVRVPLSDHLPRWVAPVLAGTQQLGALVLTTEHRLADIDLRTLERSSQVTALLLLNRRSAAEERRRASDALVAELFSGDGHDEHQLDRLSKTVGVDLSTAHAVVVALPTRPDLNVAAAAAGLATIHDWIVGCLRERIVVVVPGEDAGEAAIDAADRLGRATNSTVTVGADGPAVGAAELRTAYATAGGCLRALVVLGREGEVATIEDLGVYGLLASAADSEWVDAIIAEVLGDVLAYDLEREADLLPTLEAYVDADGQVSAVARRCHIHANTVYQRLDKVTDLSGYDWRQHEPLIQLHVAVKLLRLRRGAPSHE